MKPVGNNEWKKFVDENFVYDARLRTIAVRIINGTSLSLREKAIFENKTKEINDIIVKIKNQKSKK